MFFLAGPGIEQPFEQEANGISNENPGGKQAKVHFQLRFSAELD
jgi:hypothetical protein